MARAFNTMRLSFGILQTRVLMLFGLIGLLCVAACAPANDENSLVARIARGEIVEDPNARTDEIDIDRFRDLGFCPIAQIPEGWASLTQRRADAQSDPLDGEDPTAILYQASITQVSRECRTRGDQIFIRVGVAGRLVRGPGSTNIAGVTVPITIQAVELGGPDAGVKNETVSEAQVALSAGQPSNVWAIVENGFTAPAGSQSVVLRVGFPPQTQ